MLKHELIYFERERDCERGRERERERRKNERKPLREIEKDIVR